MKHQLKKFGILCMAMVGLFCLFGCGKETPPPAPNDQTISSDGQEVLKIDAKTTKEVKSLCAKLFDDMENGNVDAILKYYTEAELKEAAQLDLTNALQKKALIAVLKEIDFEDEFVVQPLGGDSYRISGVVETPYFGDKDYTPESIEKKLTAILDQEESIAGYEFGINRVDGQWKITDDSGFLLMVTGDLGLIFNK